MELLAINTDLDAIIKQELLSYYVETEMTEQGEIAILHAIVKRWYVHPDTLDSYNNGQPYALVEQLEDIIIDRLPEKDVLFDASILHKHAHNVVHNMVSKRYREEDLKRAR